MTGEAETPQRKMLLVAACALIDADGRVLISERPSGKQLAGTWIGVETKIACLAPLTFASHAYDSFHLLMPLFVCRRFWGTATPLEGQRLKWVRPRDLRNYPMPPADEPLIPFLIDLL